MVLEEGRAVFQGNYEEFEILKQSKGWSAREKRTQFSEEVGDPDESEEVNSIRESELSSEGTEAHKEGENLIVKEEVNEGEGGLKTYVEYFSQSPGCFCNLVLLGFSVTPFVLMGYLRFFIASWAALPLSQQ